MSNELTASDLLDELQQNARCNYLSDLREACPPEVLLRAISAISDDRYGPAHWAEAFSYLTGRQAAHPTAAAYKAELTDYLRRRG